MLKKIVIMLAAIGSIGFYPVISQAKDGDDQAQIILLNDSAAALEDSNPALSRRLAQFADQKEKEWEYKNSHKNVPPIHVTDKSRPQLQGRIKLLTEAALAIKPSYPLIAQGLEKMAKDIKRTIEIVK